MKEERTKVARDTAEQSVETQSKKPTKKRTQWVAKSLLDEVREWPSDVREEMGGQLNKVEYGGEPDDFKPMKTIGMGVNEIRVKDTGNNNYRLIYVAKFEEAIYVLHVITKKTTQKTAQSDISTAKSRFEKLQEWRKQQKL